MNKNKVLKFMISLIFFIGIYQIIISYRTNLLTDFLFGLGVMLASIVLYNFFSIQELKEEQKQ